MEELIYIEWSVSKDAYVVNKSALQQVKSKRRNKVSKSKACGHKPNKSKSRDEPKRRLRKGQKPWPQEYVNRRKRRGRKWQEKGYIK